MACEVDALPEGGTPFDGGAMILTSPDLQVFATATK
jgi:hypothetical protein